MMVPLARLILPEPLFDEDPEAGEKALSFFLPLIVWKNSDSFRIIDGCKRFRFFKAAGRFECACAIIETDFDETRAGLLRIELNSNRELGLREKLLFLGWLKKSLRPEEYQAQTQKLRIAPGERHELELLLDCNGKLLQAVLEGTLDQTVAPEMGHLNDADTDALLALFATIPFSRQMQRELVEWLHETAFTGRSCIRELLESEEFSKTISDAKLNVPQKAARIHEIAHTRRFPFYSRIKKQWNENARKLNPDTASVSFHAVSPFFEKPGLEIRIKATDAEKTQQLMERLARIPVDGYRKLIDPT